MLSNKVILVQGDELESIISRAVKAELENFKHPSEPKTHCEFLTRKQTADRLKCSLVTLNKWSKEGIIKGYRISGRVRYKSDEIELALIAMVTK
jgi:hypothetical protein